MSFSAVILAGGRSSRMGRDKAFLETGGQTWLARQIEVVRAAGATEVFVSGRIGVNYPSSSGRVLPDHFPDAGPLAGIETALAAATHPLLLVLAVDLQAMNATFLRQLLTAAAGGGAIPRLEGQTEPLAAFYPKIAHAIAERRLRRHSGAVQGFADECVQSGGARFVDFPAADAIHFQNCNSPDNLPCTT